MAEKPCVYLLHGEDELAISQYVKRLESKVGEPSLASLNTSRLVGSTLSLDELRVATSAIPVLVERRLVIVENPLQGLNSDQAKDKFINILNQLHDSTALVLIEHQTLKEGVKQKNEQPHWLIAWAKKPASRGFIRNFPLPQGVAMEKWIRQTALNQGGEFTAQAATLLSELIGDDTRMARQEIQKLLSYVSYQREVTPQDVQKLTPYAGSADDFALANALRGRDQRQAVHILHQELLDKDPLVILGSIVALYRRLIMARTILDSGGDKNQIAKELKIKPGYAYHLTDQARNFNLDELLDLYHRLLEVDVAIKTGRMQEDVALDVFVASLTVPA